MNPQMSEDFKPKPYYKQTPYFMPLVNILDILDFDLSSAVMLSFSFFAAGFSLQKRSDQSTDSDAFVICGFKGSFLKLSMHGEHLNYISFPRALSTRWLR